MFTSADSYDRFMGRYSSVLAPMFADFALTSPVQRALDVGCGPGALTGLLVARLGASAVSAVDPSQSFVDAVSKRLPGVDAHHASADDLPFGDGVFDAVLAQLVIHFVPDPLIAVAEMRRVTVDGGVVAVCVWDHGGEEGPLGAFWEAVKALDPNAPTESDLPGTIEGQLSEYLEVAGLDLVEDDALVVEINHEAFEDWWDPFTLGVGPAGSYVAGLDDERKVELREHCRRTLPDPPFASRGKAWAARGIAV